LRSQMY